MNAIDLAARFDELLTMTRKTYDTFIEQTERALREERPSLLAIDEDAAPAADLQLDLTLVRAAPVAVVPSHCEFRPLTENGHRFLAAHDGLYLEVRRPWLHLIRRIADQTAVRMPYGRIGQKAELAFGGIGSALPQLQAFARQAREHLPVETAASLIWHSGTKEWDLRVPEVIGTASATRIQYRQVDLADDEHLVIDLHSHGQLPAGFSPTDDEDDYGSVKIAGVFGNVDPGSEPSLAFRLCVLGIYIPIAVPADRVFGSM
ncbi:MAG TPA: PRTRC system protein A [Telluria sp.]